MKHRLRQFKKALIAKLTFTDVEFVRKYLSHPEQILFYCMRVYDQKHALEVAGKCLAENFLDGDINRAKLIRAALLHDVGKAYTKVSLFIRVLYVLSGIKYDRVEANKQKDRTKPTFLNQLYVLSRHADLGALMLEQIDEDKEIIEVVRNHNSSPQSQESHILPIIRSIDKSV